MSAQSLPLYAVEGHRDPGGAGQGVMALDPIPEAIQYLRDGHAQGKVVVNL